MKNGRPTEVNAAAESSIAIVAYAAQTASFETIDRPPPVGIWPAKRTMEGRLLARMLHGSSWTSNEWLQAAGSSRLASFVHKLRAAGWNIGSELIDVPTRDGVRRARIARYALADTQARATLDSAEGQKFLAEVELAEGGGAK